MSSASKSVGRFRRFSRGHWFRYVGVALLLALSIELTPSVPVSASDAPVSAVVPPSNLSRAIPNPLSLDPILRMRGDRPRVTINQANGQADPTNVNSILFNVVFSEPVTGFDASDINLNQSTTAWCNRSVTVTGDGPVYTVRVTGMLSSGYVIANIPAAVAYNSEGHSNRHSTSDDNVVWYPGLPGATCGDGGGGGIIMW